MPRRTIVVAALAAFLLSSCADSAEVARARAEAEASKAEVEMLKAEVESLKASLKAKEPPPAPDLTGLVTRWNAAAANTTFRWDGKRFPHPTFQGGTAERYGAFSKVLVAFADGPDNFDYAAKNKLFTANLDSGVSMGGGKTSGFTLAQLYQQFSMPGGFGDVDAADRVKLKAFSDRIQAAIK